MLYAKCYVLHVTCDMYKLFYLWGNRGPRALLVIFNEDPRTSVWNSQLKGGQNHISCQSQGHHHNWLDLAASLSKSQNMSSLFNTVVAGQYITWGPREEPQPPQVLSKRWTCHHSTDDLSLHQHKDVKICWLWYLSLIHIWRCRRIERCRSRWSPYH